MREAVGHSSIPPVSEEVPMMTCSFSFRSPIACALVAVLTVWSGDVLAQADPSAANDGEATEEGAQTAEAAADRREAKKRRLADRIKSVQRKVFLKKKRFELYPYFGLDLNDPFYQHYVLGFSGAYHFADSFAVEARYGRVIGRTTQGAVKLVRVNAGAICENCPEFEQHLDVDLNWSPIYGKISLFGESIVHFDTYLTAGPGLFGTDNGFNPAVNVGIGQRYFINDWLVVRAELRNYIFVEKREEISDVQNLLILGLSVSAFLPLSFEYDFR